LMLKYLSEWKGPQWSGGQQSRLKQNSLKEWKMNKWSSILKVALASSLFAASSSGFAAYISPSTGADGAFNPTASQSIQLPPDGIFNYTGVNIPAGVVITYIKNAANTPVTILATGDVTIAGTINVSATQPANISDPGIGGPGGYDGGHGGQPGGTLSTWVAGYNGANVGTAGIGPGGASPGQVTIPDRTWHSYPESAAGGGGAYGVTPVGLGSNSCPTVPGVAYGNSALIPLVGGSGGGGGAGGPTMSGSGGGGGGGAILIASSGTINVTGSILANGGTPISPIAMGYGRGASGGGGSGGAIRLIATTVSGNGTISAVGGVPATEQSQINISSTPGTYYVICDSSSGGLAIGSVGRIRIEAESVTRTAATIPTMVSGTPSLVSVPGLPTLRIDTIGGVAVPAVPTGSADVTLPAGTTNPVTVAFSTTGVTVGSSIKLTVTPVKGTAYSATSTPTAGTTSLATASVSVNLPSGTNNTLQASVTYTVVASIGNAMGVYAQGERVKTITLATTLGSKASTVTLTTMSGKEYVVPASVLALAKLPS
jgi:hypothetical protein